MDIPSRLELAEQLLKWRHLCPNCPDLLFGFPTSVDPFVLEESPHVFFIGNQRKYQTKLVEGPEGQKIRIILLPSFARDSTIILINLDTLECSPVVFNTYDPDTKI